MIENAPINIMYTDLDLKIQYMNPASIRTLKQLEAYLPIKVDDMIGTVDRHLPQASRAPAAGCLPTPRTCRMRP